MQWREDKCKIGRNGHCNTHNMMTRKVTVTSKKWKDRKDGKGFGWVSTKVTRFQCSGVKINSIEDPIFPNVRGSVIMQGENNEVMTSEVGGIND